MRSSPSSPLALDFFEPFDAPVDESAAPIASSPDVLSSAEVVAVGAVTVGEDAPPPASVANCWGNGMAQPLKQGRSSSVVTNVPNRRRAGRTIVLPFRQLYHYSFQLNSVKACKTPATKNLHATSPQIQSPQLKPYCWMRLRGWMPDKCLPPIRQRSQVSPGWPRRPWHHAHPQEFSPYDEE